MLLGGQAHSALEGKVVLAWKNVKDLPTVIHAEGQVPVMALYGSGKAMSTVVSFCQLKLDLVSFYS